MQCEAFHHTAETIRFSEWTKVADTQFKPGDTVSLRSGGPLMTIVMIDGQYAFCEWFVSEPQPQGRAFALTSLKRDEQR
jgi:uncharacterized protein YodC (DUF2158 family)